MELLASLRDDLRAVGPDVIVVSGDITDRGRKYQYRQAIDFLKSVGGDIVVVPGNREICGSTFWEWMIPSLSMTRYRSFMGSSDRIVFRSDEDRVLIVGLNSVHFFPSWPGSVSRETRYWFRSLVSGCDGYFKAVALHHPVAPVIHGSSFWAHQLSDAAAILKICFEHGVRLILQGHKHRSSFLEIREPQSESRVVISSCGAPLAKEGDRIYHILENDGGLIRATTREWVDGRFVQRDDYSFQVGKDQTVAKDAVSVP